MAGTIGGTASGSFYFLVEAFSFLAEVEAFLFPVVLAAPFLFLASFSLLLEEPFLPFSADLAPFLPFFAASFSADLELFLPVYLASFLESLPSLTFFSFTFSSDLDFFGALASSSFTFAL